MSEGEHARADSPMGDFEDEGGIDAAGECDDDARHRRKNPAQSFQFRYECVGHLYMMRFFAALSPDSNEARHARMPDESQWLSRNASRHEKILG